MSPTSEAANVYAGKKRRSNDPAGQPDVSNRTASNLMSNGLIALLWLNLRVRWREWSARGAEGVFLQQMRALRAADVIRPSSPRHLRLVRATPQRARQVLRRVA